MQLSGKLLVAMPSMEDPRFARSVILVCAHGADSAMGLVVNKPSQDLDFSALLKHLEVEKGPNAREISVQSGGPVERGRGFVLHSADWHDGARPSVGVPGGFRLTATLDILNAFAAGGGPRQALLALGYAGWGAGQLEAEIGRNDWLVVDATPELVFGANNEAKWAQAMLSIGIGPSSLSSVAGRA